MMESLDRHQRHQQGIERYVTERALNHTELMRVDEHTPKAPEPKHRASHQGVGVESLEVSHEIEEGIRKMRYPNVPRKKRISGKDQKKAEEVRVSSKGVDGHDELDETWQG